MTQYYFDKYLLDTQRCELTCAGQPVPLQPKVFRVLVYLLRHRDRVVPKHELLEHLWPGQFIADATLNSCIKVLRRAIGDQGQKPYRLRTVRGLGYRFVVPVTVQEGGVPAAVPPQDAPPGTAGPVPQDPPSSPLAVDAAPDAVVPLEADEEHKPVTVLCCALVDAPALATRLSPEALHQLMQTLLAQAQAVLRRYDGTLTHVTGDGFTALFGAPLAQEDHARRAVLAALELRQRLRDLPTPGGWHPAGDLAVSMGLHSGRVVIGQLPQAPHHLYTAGSPTAYLAARLQQRAAPGTILLSAATQQLVQQEVVVDADGTLAGDGRFLPVAGYAVQGLVQRRAGVAGRGPRHQRPFVGRERELALLHARLDQVTQGQGQVVGIIAEPGMGKTRLVEEFRRSLAERPVTFYIGHCLPYGQATPYLPVLNLLRQCCGITETDTHAAITRKVHQCLRESDLTLQDEAPWLLRLLDVPVAEMPLPQLAPHEQKTRTFALLHHLVLQACRRQPLILVVENLHWIDATSEAWLATLSKRLTGASILLLVTYRPGYRPPWLEQSMATQVALPGLLPRESITVVQSVPGAAPLPHALVQEIVTKAAGNPFFIEELTWAITTHDGRHTLLLLPDTVQAVLAARIDQLPAAAKRCLQVAAVIGPEVPLSLLQAVATTSADALHDGLAQLQAAEFLYEMRTVPTPVYRFKHVLTQEVAYASLLHERRRRLHCRVLETLEQLAPDRLEEQVEWLAHHALQGEVWDKAVTYCRQAGAKALGRSASGEAVVCFEQALRAVQQLPEGRERHEQAIDVRFSLRNALVPFGQTEHHRLRLYLEEAGALAQALHDRHRQGWAAVHMIHYFWFIGDCRHAVEVGQRALTMTKTLGDIPLQVVANLHLGRSYLALGDYGRAMDLFRNNLRLLTGDVSCERFGEVLQTGLPALPSVQSRTWLAWCLAEQGAFTDGLACSAEGLRIAEAVAHPFSLVEAYRGMSHIHLRRGEWHQAIRWCERALDVCREWELPVPFQPITAALCYAYALSGQVSAALSLLEQTASTGAMAPRWRGLSQVWLSEAYLRLGRLAEALKLAARALEFLHAHGYQGEQAWALRLLGELHMHSAPRAVEQSAACYRQALALANALGMRPLTAHCYHGLGTLYSWTGRRAEGCTALTAAVDLYRGMEMRFWLPQAEAALGQVTDP